MVITLATEHLPADVVKQDVVISLYSLTPDKENEPRKGTLNAGYSIGGRENAILTADEFAYTLAILREAPNYWLRHKRQLIGEEPRS